MQPICDARGRKLRACDAPMTVGVSVRRQAFWTIDRARGAPIGRHLEDIRASLDGRRDPLEQLQSHAVVQNAENAYDGTCNLSGVGSTYEWQTVTTPNGAAKQVCQGVIASQRSSELEARPARGGPLPMPRPHDSPDRPRRTKGGASPRQGDRPPSALAGHTGVLTRSLTSGPGAAALLDSEAATRPVLAVRTHSDTQSQEHGCERRNDQALRGPTWGYRRLCGVRVSVEQL